MPKAISLFTGAGGSDLGLEQAGFEVVMANDVLPYARDFYLKNVGDTDYKVCDVGEIVSFPDADLLVGCYPCQGFSQAGAREPSRQVNYLYREFVRALRVVKPKAFIVENVSGMLRADNAQLYRNQLVRFRLAGYRVKAKVLDARSFGVAQERARLFFVGVRSDLGVSYDFPSPSHHFGEEYSGLPSTPVLRDVIGDLPHWPEGEFDEQPFHWYYLSRNRYRGWGQFSKTIVAHSRHVPLHPLSPRLERIHTDKWVFSTDDRARRLSYREAARIQGFEGAIEFPDTYGLAMKYKVVGNAVPPPLFCAVAKALPDVW